MTGTTDEVVASLPDADRISAAEMKRDWIEAIDAATNRLAIAFEGPRVADEGVPLQTLMAMLREAVFDLPLPPISLRRLYPAPGSLVAEIGLGAHAPFASDPEKLRRALETFWDSAPDAIESVLLFGGKRPSGGDDVLEVRIERPGRVPGERQASPGYEHYGSVEGPAEALDLHGEPFFTVRDMVTGLPVRCYFGNGDREAIAAIVAGKRIVSAEGMLRRGKDGRLLSIRPLHSFAVVDEPLPGEWESPAGLFAGIGDTQAYLREIRGG